MAPGTASRSTSPTSRTAATDNGSSTGSITHATAHAAGQWSPLTTDLPNELPALVRSLRADGFTLRRVMFNPADWDSRVPRATDVDGRVVKLGAFNYQSRRTVTVVDDDGSSRMTLLLPELTRD